VKVRFGRGAKPLEVSSQDAVTSPAVAMPSTVDAAAPSLPPPAEAAGVVPAPAPDDCYEDEEPIAFGSTKGRQVKGNVSWFGAIQQPRKYSQYLNLKKPSQDTDR
jgi:hypothetical protein